MGSRDNDDLVKVTADELLVGDTLPWTVFDATGRLLMDAGNVVSSQSRLNSIVASGYRKKDMDAAVEATSDIVINLPAPHQYAKDTNPFNELEEMCHELEKALVLLLAKVVLRRGVCRNDCTIQLLRFRVYVI
jgi:hypothetical protein